MLAWDDIFQRPYFYHPASLAIHPMLAAEVAALVRRSTTPYFGYEAVMTEPPRDFGPGRNESGRNAGFGASFSDPAEALAKSVWEAWERKFSKVYSPQSLVVGSYSELASRAVDPHTFALISDWEIQQSPIEYVRFHPDLKLSWKECFQVADASLRPVLIPATLVYSRFGWKNPAERFAPNLSPGLACHSTYREAFLSGLCELLERDAFMLAWLHRRSPPRVRPDTVPFDDAAQTMDWLTSLGFVAHFADLTSDSQIPVILTLIEHPRLPWDGTLVPGLGCHLDPAVALRKSLLEALIMLTNFAKIDLARSEITVTRPSLPFGLDRADYFRKVRFLVESSTEIAFGDMVNHDRRDPGRNLETLIERLSALGHAIYFVDLTPPGYDGCRICLTRAFIAGLQPMLYEPDCWRLNPLRLFGAAPPAFDRLNLMPHPFMLME